MTADIGVMPITHAVHYIRTLQPEVSVAFNVPDFGHLLQEVTSLPGISTRLLLSLLIPFGIYFVIKRLRYLSKLRSEHKNVFEAALGRPPFVKDQLNTEVKKEQESSPVENRENLFQTSLTSPLDNRLEPL